MQNFMDCCTLSLYFYCSPFMIQKLIVSGAFQCPPLQWKSYYVCSQGAGLDLGFNSIGK